MKRIPRTHPIRRKLNDAFYGFGDPEGHFSWSKFVGVWGQIMVLFHTGAGFPQLITHPDTLAICLVFIIAPDTFRKFLAMKYGGSTK